MKLLNLGCGGIVHGEWINLDLTASCEGVEACDLVKGIPAGNSECDALYLAHLLEHLRIGDAGLFLRECFRVLKPRGVIRVVVPDLENIAASYLRQLQSAKQLVLNADLNLRWMTMELLDQCVREKGGGMMLDLLRTKDSVDEGFVVERLGRETYQALKALAVPGRAMPKVKRSIIHLLWCLWRVIRYSDCRREVLIKYLLGRNEYEMLEVGRFRRSGEIHCWMYDEISLKLALQAAGFVGIVRCNYNESGIPGWGSYQFDSESGGLPRQPASLYMEALKPGAE